MVARSLYRLLTSGAKSGDEIINRRKSLKTA